MFFQNSFSSCDLCKSFSLKSTRQWLWISHGFRPLSISGRFAPACLLTFDCQCSRWTLGVLLSIFTFACVPYGGGGARGCGERGWVGGIDLSPPFDWQMSWANQRLRKTCLLTQWGSADQTVSSNSHRHENLKQNLLPVFWKKDPKRVCFYDVRSLKMRTSSKMFLWCS